MNQDRDLVADRAARAVDQMSGMDDHVLGCGRDGQGESPSAKGGDRNDTRHGLKVSAAAGPGLGHENCCKAGQAALEYALHTTKWAGFHRPFFLGVCFCAWAKKEIENKE